MFSGLWLIVFSGLSAYRDFMSVTYWVFRSVACRVFRSVAYRVFRSVAYGFVTVPTHILTAHVSRMQTFTRHVQ